MQKKQYNYDYKNLLEEFSNYLKIMGYSTSTLYTYPIYIKEFLLWQEQNKNNDIRKITPSIIQAYYEYLQTRPCLTKPGGLSQSTISGRLYVIRLLFKYLITIGAIKTDPISGIYFPKFEYNKRTAISVESVKQLYEAAETLRDRAMLGLFYGCGLRRSEGENLNTADIRLKENVLIVREGKGQKRRVVPLAEGVKHDFENYYKVERPYYLKKDNPAFMINNKGRRMTRDCFGPRLSYLVKKSGINESVCLHQLRHSIATHLMEQGMSLENVRDFLGHKYIDTTQRYTHISKLKLL